MSELRLDLKHHTVIELAGVSGVGKSHISNLLQKEARFMDVGCVVISSDAIRLRLLGKLPTDNARTLEAQTINDQTFKILFTELECFMSYPVNTPLIIVDTTGLDLDTRKLISKLCKKHMYNHDVLILNPSIEAIEANIKKNVGAFMLPVVKDQLENFNYHLAALRNPNFHDQIIEVNEYIKDVRVSFTDIEMIDRVTLNSNVAVIGDVHESLDILKELISKVSKKYPDIIFYLLGDWIDKGGYTKEIIDYLIEHPDIRLVIGNHENYVYRAINGIQDKRNRNMELEAKFFTAVGVLENDPAYKAKFNFLHDRCLPFLQIRHPKLVAFFSHAPCESKHIGKLNKISLTEQMKQIYTDKISLGLQMSFLIKEAGNFKPFYVFGHTPCLKDDHVHKNIICIDQGAAYKNGALTAFIIKPDYSTELMSVENKVSEKHQDFISFEIIKGYSEAL